MTTGQAEFFSMRGSKGLVKLVLVVLATGGLTAGAYRLLATDAQATPPPAPIQQPCPECLGEAKVVAIARAEAEKVQVQSRQELKDALTDIKGTQAELRAAVQTLQQTATRLETLQAQPSRPRR